jgi:hypothetical protein
MSTDRPPQTYATHAYRPRTWNVTWLLAAVALLLLMWRAIVEPTWQALALVLLGASVFLTVTLLRVFTLRLQNRIIRLEMQIRLTRIGRADDLTRLTLPQVIALRFASDAELPALADRAREDGLTPKQIKQAVRDWQGDYLRT